MQVIAGIILIGLALWAMWLLMKFAAIVALKTITFFLESLVIVPESMAHAFSRLGVREPEVGWLLLGALLGALAGVVIGLRRAGRPLAPSRVRVISVAVFGVLLLAGAGAPVPADDSPVTPVPRADTPSTRVRVLAGGVIVRAGPSLDARPLGTLPAGTELTAERHVTRGNGWYAVTVRRGTQSIDGWVSASRVTRPTGVVPSFTPVRPSPDAAARRSPPADSTSSAPKNATIEPNSPAPVSEPTEQEIKEVRQELTLARVSAGRGAYEAAGQSLVTVAERLGALARKYPDANLGELNREYEELLQSTASACRAEAAIAASRGTAPPLCP